MVGFPKTIHALYVEQLEGTDGNMSVLNTVMQADKEVLVWRQQASLLQAGFMPHAFVEDPFSPLIKTRHAQPLPIADSSRAPQLNLRSILCCAMSYTLHDVDTSIYLPQSGEI